MDLMRAALLVAIGTLALPPPAAAQVGAPLGAEFVVNSYTTDDQTVPSVAADARGAFAVVWQSAGQDGAGWGIFGQRHDAAGGATGAEFRVNTATAGHQAYPRAASSPAGEFLVVWDSFGQDGNSFGVFGQVYDAAGAPRGAEFQVNAHAPGNQAYPAVAAGPDGAFAVVWEDSSRDGAGLGVFGRVFDAAGTPRGDDFRVNAFTSGTQAAPAVAWTGQAGFVVVWHGANQDGSSFGIVGQRFDSTGAASGSEFAVNSSTLGVQALPAVAADPTGAFVVVWASGGYEGSGAGIFGQRYDAAGTPEGPEFVVNAYTTGSPVFPVVASSRTGFVVAWQSAERDGSGEGILAQRHRGDSIFADGFE